MWDANEQNEVFMSNVIKLAQNNWKSKIKVDWLSAVYINKIITCIVQHLTD